MTYNITTIRTKYKMFEDPRFHKYAMAPAMKGMVAAVGASFLVGGESKL